MPNGLFVQIYKDLLKGDLFAGKSPTGSLNIGTQIVTINSDVVLVDRRLFFTATWPHKALKGVQSGLSMLLKSLRVK